MVTLTAKRKLDGKDQQLEFVTDAPANDTADVIKANFDLSGLNPATFSWHVQPAASNAYQIGGTLIAIRV